MKRIVKQDKVSEIVYSSKLKDWDSRASVRVTPRRQLQDEQEQGKVFFPEDLIPALSHPHLTALGPEAFKGIPVQRLYNYLHATVQLERHIVNPATLLIAEGGCDVDLPLEMRRDGDRIYTDEAWHAQFSNDLADQVQVQTGIIPVLMPQPSFFYGLQKKQRAVPARLRTLCGLFAAITNETLISAFLGSVPRDPSVVTAVREEVADHARDEATHFRYFSDVARAIFPRLSLSQKQVVAPLLADFVIDFLTPDLAATRKMLETLPSLTSTQIEEVLAEVYAPDLFLDGIRQAARHTLNLFEELGVFDDARAEDAFHERGLRVR